MMKNYGLTIALALAALISGVTAIWFSPERATASNVTAARYVGIVRVTNNGSALAHVFVPFSLNSSRMEAAGYLNSTLSDSAIISNIGTDVAFMPAPGTTNTWAAYVISLPESATEYEEINTDYLLYLGGSDNMQAPIRYFPGDAGMSWSDAATIELGDNWTIEQSGWINSDNGAEKNFLHKQSALIIYISGDNEITAETRGGASTSNTTLRPSGAGSATQIDTVSGNASNWQAVADWVADGDTSYVSDTDTGVGGNPYDLYALPNPGLSANTTDIDVTVYARARQTGAVEDIQLYAWPVVYTNGTLAESSQRALSTSYQTFTWYLASNPVTGVEWTPAEIDALQAGVRVNADPGPSWDEEVRVTQVYAWVEYVEESVIDSVTATGVNTGENTIAVSANVTHLAISVNGSAQDSTVLSGNVTNNSNTWYAFQNDAMPYVDYHRVTINGTVTQFITWQHLNTFTDQSGNGHDVTPTFRDAPSDSNVAAELLSLKPITEAQVDDYTLGTTGNLTQLPTEPAQFYSEGTVSFPGASVFNRALDVAGIPHTIFWFPLTALTIIAAGFFTYKLTPSLFIKSTVQFVFLIFAALVNIWGGWAALYFALWAISLLVISKHYSF